MIIFGIVGLVVGQDMMSTINCQVGDMSPMRAASYYNQMGITAMESEVMDAAEEYFNCAIRHNADYYAPFYNRGKMAFELEQYDKALIDFQHVVDYAPKPVPEYYLYIAISYDHLSDPENALRSYLQYSELIETPDELVKSRIGTLQSNLDKHQS